MNSLKKETIIKILIDFTNILKSNDLSSQIKDICKNLNTVNQCLENNLIEDRYLLSLLLTCISELLFRTKLRFDKTLLTKYDDLVVKTMYVSIKSSSNYITKSDLTIHNVLWKILVIITIKLENLKESSESSNLSVCEAMEFYFFSSYSLILNIWYRKRESISSSSSSLDHSEFSKAFKSLKGPHLAQIIQLALHYSKSISKEVATSALECLIHLIETVGHLEDWKLFIPGIFTSLHYLSLSGYKR
jgi:hypothetical protein